MKFKECGVVIVFKFVLELVDLFVERVLFGWHRRQKKVKILVNMAKTTLNLSRSRILCSSSMHIYDF